jgi:hypothetical protein
LAKIAFPPSKIGLIVIITDFDVGVLLISAKLSIGIKTFVSGK